MPSPLHPAQRLVAALALCACLAQPALAAAPAQAPALTPTAIMPEALTLTPKAVILTPDERMVANHGGESGAAATVGSGVVGNAATSSLVGAVKSTQARQSYSDSLWGNMLLNMAIQRDAEINRLARRLGLVNGLTVASVAGIAGLGLAQSIDSYRRISPEPATYNVVEAHHAGGHDHIHMPPESRVPATLGIIGSGATLLTLGAQTVANTYYGRKLANRQLVLRKQVDDILSRLEAAGLETSSATQSFREELASLVGLRATTEFLTLWRVLHPETQAVGN